MVLKADRVPVTAKIFSKLDWIKDDMKLWETKAVFSYDSAQPYSSTRMDIYSYHVCTTNRTYLVVNFAFKECDTIVLLSEFPVKTCKSKKKKRKKRITIIDDDNNLRTLKLIDEKIEKYLN